MGADNSIFIGKFIVLYFLSVNLIAFFMFYIDKRRAKNREFRISECALLGISLIGGCFGALLSMKLLRHKTRKKRFYITIPIVCVVYITVFLKLSRFL